MTPDENATEIMQECRDDANALLLILGAGHDSFNEALQSPFGKGLFDAGVEAGIAAAFGVLRRHFDLEPRRDRNDRGEVDGYLIAGLVVLVMFLLLFSWGAIGARP